MESFSFISFLLILISNHLASAQPTTDSAEVSAIRKMMDQWELGNKMNSSIDPCTQNAPWTSVDANPRVACACNANTCHITHLKVYALDIKGEIPKELFVLKELIDLNLGQNVLNGSIPAEIGQLSKMQYLSLGINNFTGSVPAELGNLTKLISLSFSSNNFFGTLPPELGNLTSLQQLYVDSSGVSGPIPPEFAKLKSLQILWGSDNSFTGKIPEFLGTFTGFKNLRLEGTQLEGPIPSSFADLTNLQDLRIGDLTGEDSSLDFLENQTSLSILSLRNCRLSGQIPDNLSKMTKLQYMDLSFNMLTGQIPSSFNDLAQLQYLYIGSNNLTGEVPVGIITPQLNSLDVSFNPLTGNLPSNSTKVGLSINIVGTSISADTLQCLQGTTKCTTASSTSFSINCGGTSQKSASNVEFGADSAILGAASLYASSDGKWAVSNIGSFISNPNGNQYIAMTDSQVTETLDSELYKTARVSPNSLRYFGIGLQNGKYNVELHFAEIQMDDDTLASWKGLGRRVFDVYIQGERVLGDFDVKKEAGGSKRALVKQFVTNVTNTIMDIHFMWAGKGTCCIPYQSTFGPLVSAVHVSQVFVSDTTISSSKEKNKVGKIIGITMGCVVGFVVITSLLYLMWKKQPQLQGHAPILTDSPKKANY